MVKFAPVLLLVLFSSLHAQAQTAEDSVKSVITQLFDAMKNADSNKLKNVFADSALLQTIVRSKEGKATVRNEPVNKFIDFVGKLQNGAADERIQFETIKIDGPLAAVWTPYKFYFNGQFVHCGVNSFQMVRMAAGWKIQYIIDTRKKEGCD